jgi:hypothetical protein
MLPQILPVCGFEIGKGKIQMRFKASIGLSIAIMTALVGLPFMASQASARSSSFCENYAHDYATRKSRGRVLGGTALASGGGAAIGGIANGRRGARTGAAIGAGAGLILGSSARSNNYNHYFNRAYRRCRNG